MNIRILTADDMSTWREPLRSQLETDVYFLPEYHRVYELNGDGIAKAFVAQDRDKLLFYPFLVRPIEAVLDEPLAVRWYDIETVYGYTGPLSNSGDTRFLSDAWGMFSEWCRDNSIIAEFVRFSPLLNNHAIASPHCKVSFDRQTVLVDLETSETALWNHYSSAHRNMIRKALKNSLECHEVDPARAMNTFMDLYYQTMQKNSANRYYFFSEAYFGNLMALLGNRLKLFTTHQGDLVVAASLVLAHDHTIHYHLSASRQGYQKFAPTDLLLHTISLWGMENGFRRFHLGGGRTAHEDDALLKFKSGASRARCRYYTGRTVHNPAAYEDLCSRWMSSANVSVRPDYFLLYRMEMP